MTKHSSVVLKTMTPLSLGQPRLVSHIIHYDAFTNGTNLYPRGAWFAHVMMSFSGATFVLFGFVFVFIMLSLKRRPFVQSFFDNQAPR